MKRRKGMGQPGFLPINAGLLAKGEPPAEKQKAWRDDAVS